MGIRNELLSKKTHLLRPTQKVGYKLLQIADIAPILKGTLLSLHRQPSAELQSPQGALIPLTPHIRKEDPHSRKKVPWYGSHRLNLAYEVNPENVDSMRTAVYENRGRVYMRKKPSRRNQMQGGDLLVAVPDIYGSPFAGEPYFQVPTSRIWQHASIEWPQLSSVEYYFYLTEVPQDNFPEYMQFPR
jgi:hypothetical protein